MELEGEKNIPSKTQAYVAHCVRSYNAALLDSEKRKSFLDEEYDTKRVGIQGIEEREKGDYMDVTNFKPFLVPEEHGDLLVVEIDKEPYLFPGFEIDVFHFYTLKTCYWMERNGKRLSPENPSSFLEKVEQPAKIKSEGNRYQVAEKGLVTIFGEEE